MALMTFTAVGVNGGAAYTLAHNPTSIRRPHKQKDVFVMKTWSSSAAINWGFLGEQSGLIGERVILSWSHMRVSPDWEKLVQYYETEEAVTWDPQEKAHNGTSSYEVAVVRLDGNDMETNLTYRKDVELELEIRRVV